MSPAGEVIVVVCLVALAASVWIAGGHVATIAEQMTAQTEMALHSPCRSDEVAR